jgi:hypothetical protein
VDILLIRRDILRKLLLILIVLLTMMLSFGTSAERINTISLQDANKTMLANNSSIKQLDYSLIQSRKQYDDAVESAQGVGLEAIKRKLAGFNMELDTYAEIMMTKQRDYYPKMMQNYVFTAFGNRTITENSLKSGLRGLYQALLAASWDYDIKDRKFQLEKTKYGQQKDKFNNGMISKIELEAADYNLLQASMALDSAKRNRQNVSRLFNSYIGVDINIQYDTIEFNGPMANISLKPLDTYVSDALKWRLEIKSMQNDIELKQLDMSILQPGLTIADLNRQYHSDERSIAMSNPELEKKKYELEAEIKNAYVDVTKEQSNIKKLENALANQKRQLDKLRLQADAGYAAPLAITEMQIAIDELSNSYNLEIFTFNTKLVKLNNAAGYGPAYNTR